MEKVDDDFLVTFPSSVLEGVSLPCEVSVGNNPT